MHNDPNLFQHSLTAVCFAWLQLRFLIINPRAPLHGWNMDWWWEISAAVNSFEMFCSQSTHVHHYIFERFCQQSTQVHHYIFERFCWQSLYQPVFCFIAIPQLGRQTWNHYSGWCFLFSFFFLTKYELTFWLAEVLVWVTSHACSLVWVCHMPVLSYKWCHMPAESHGWCHMTVWVTSHACSLVWVCHMPVLSYKWCHMSVAMLARS